MVKLMVKWNQTSTGGEVQDVPKTMYKGSLGRIGKCIIVNIPIPPETITGLTQNFKEILK